MTIMTADDSASMRQLIAFTLRSAGYDVVEAVDGRDALEKITAKPVHMLVADLNMPRLDGLELTRQVRALPSCKYIPILMVTTECRDDKKRAARGAGASGWIVKPFRSEQLVAAVKKLLG